MSGSARVWRVGEVVASVAGHPSNQGRRGRALARMFLFQFRARVLHRDTTVPLGERSKVTASLSHAASIQVAFANPPDPEHDRVWRRHLTSGDWFIDIGANVGTYAILIAEQDVDVTAFEPDPGAAALLRANASLNGYQIEVREEAVGENAGTAFFTTGLDTMNHIAAHEGGGTREVPVVTLDDVLGDRVLAGLKVDVEGAEGAVLRGAARALSEGRIRLIQLEWNLMSRSVFGESRDVQRELLRSYGYDIFRPVGGALVPDDGEEGSIDVFAAQPAVAAQLGS